MGKGGGTMVKEEEDLFGPVETQNCTLTSLGTTLSTPCAGQASSRNAKKIIELLY